MDEVSALRGKVERIKIAVSGVHVPPSVIVLLDYKQLDLIRYYYDLDKQIFKF